MCLCAQGRADFEVIVDVRGLSNLSAALGGAWWVVASLWGKDTSIYGVLGHAGATNIIISARPCAHAPCVSPQRPLNDCALRLILSLFPGHCRSCKYTLTVDYSVSTMTASNIIRITDKDSHDVIARAGENGTPTVIYVSFSPLPVCRAFTPKFEALAAKPEYAEAGIVFAQMELDKETTYILKFGVQTCPICICLKKGWCKTLLPGARIETLEACVRENLMVAKDE